VGGTCAGGGAVGERRGRAGAESAGSSSRCCCLISHANAISQFYFIRRFCSYRCYFFFVRRPLLTVETEANGDLWSTNEWGPSLVGFFGSSCQYKRFLSCLDYFGQPSTKYFSALPYTILLYVSPSPSNLGKQSCRVAILLMCACGCCHRERNIEKELLFSSEYCLKRTHLHRMSPAAV
jgi:hypothetical protein